MIQARIPRQISEQRLEYAADVVVREKYFTWNWGPSRHVILPPHHSLQRSTDANRLLRGLEEEGIDFHPFTEFLENRDGE